MTGMESNRAKPPTIQVTGRGSVRVKPDVASIDIGVTTEDANAASALARNNSATAKVVSELEAAKIDPKDLQTSNFSIYPQYKTEGENKRQLTTYRVTNTVTATIRDLDRIGEILERAVKAGSNQIYGPQFSVSQPQKYLDDARKMAVEDARRKAEIYAAAAGMRLGSPVYISENTASAPVFEGARLMRPQGAPPPIRVGEESIHAEVTISFELKGGS